MAGCGATISLLPVSLSLVHIPRPRIQDLIHPILRQILLPNPTFLNITCNEIELSVFAEHHALQDFESAARRDARKLKNISRERSAGGKDDKKKSPTTASWEGIELSHERWNVLQIDSHSGGPGECACVLRLRPVTFISVLAQTTRVPVYMNSQLPWRLQASRFSTNPLT